MITKRVRDFMEKGGRIFKMNSNGKTQIIIMDKNRDKMFTVPTRNLKIPPKNSK